MEHLLYNQLKPLVDRVEANAERVAKLGGWAKQSDPRKSLVERVSPLLEHEATAPGFDAGIACCLDLIPRDKQRLSAILHANYSPEAVEQVRAEIDLLFPDTETCWWLYACSHCTERQYGTPKISYGEARRIEKGVRCRVEWALRKILLVARIS